MYSCRARRRSSMRSLTAPGWFAGTSVFNTGSEGTGVWMRSVMSRAASGRRDSRSSGSPAAGRLVGASSASSPLPPVAATAAAARSAAGQASASPTRWQSRTGRPLTIMWISRQLAQRGGANPARKSARFRSFTGAPARSTGPATARRRTGCMTAQPSSAVAADRTSTSTRKAPSRAPGASARRPRQTRSRSASRKPVAVVAARDTAAASASQGSATDPRLSPPALRRRSSFGFRVARLSSLSR
mmetsp:Transcript_31830/g.101271  ORF Transcript_31830/g.101271 Transcript_31830/m.101271 type:complete len:244 (-) Transcript_31830:106-837(-)